MSKHKELCEIDVRDYFLDRHDDLYNRIDLKIKRDLDFLNKDDLKKIDQFCHSFSNEIIYCITESISAYHDDLLQAIIHEISNLKK